MRVPSWLSSHLSICSNLKLTTCAVFVLAFFGGHAGIVSGASAKTPGKTYCFLGTCHRVLTLAQTRRQVGRRSSLVASFYSDCKVDRYNPCGLTSSGAVFKPSRADNAASPIYPNGTKLLVWNPANKRAAVIRIDNAGPYWGNRTLDLSRAAAQKLGFRKRGVARLTVQVISAPSRREATYRRNRVYPSVPGYIGRYPSFATAALAATGKRVSTKPKSRTLQADNSKATTAKVRRPLRVVSIQLPAQRPARRIAVTTPNPSRIVTAMIELPTENIPFQGAAQREVPASQTFSIRLPTRLARLDVPASVKRTATKRRRLAALTRQKNRKLARAKRVRATAVRRIVAEKAKQPEKKIKSAAKATTPVRKPKKIAARPELKPTAPKKTIAKAKRQVVAAKSNRENVGQANGRRAIPAPQASPAPAVVQRPRLAWRQKYFGMNRGGT